MDHFNYKSSKNEEIITLFTSSNVTIKTHSINNVVEVWQKVREIEENCFENDIITL